MTSNNDVQFYGPPPPVTELTMEQSFKLRRMRDMMPEASKEDLITILDALQHQNFCLCNTVSNLVKNWPARPTTPEAQ
jgi:hypothetical protein